MTREHKLAIILGFSVLLIVGLLVGDHFSKARRPQGGAEVVIAPTEPNSQPTPALVDPMAPRELATGPSGGIPAGPGRDSLTLVDPDTGRSSIEPIVMGERRELVTTRIPVDSARLPTAPSGLPGDEMADLRNRLAGLSQTPVQGNLPTDPTQTVITDRSGKPATPAQADRMHPVEAGQTLYSIAKQYYNDPTLWKDLAKYNESRVKGDAVRVGVTLRIPTKDVLLGRVPATAPTTPTIQPTNTSRPPSVLPSPRSTRITESEPATTAARPVLGNPLTGVDTVPADPVTPAAQPKPKTYTVKSGDTLMQIAQKSLGDSKRWRELLTTNKDKLAEPEDLQVGMVLKLPAK